MKRGGEAISKVVEIIGWMVDEGSGSAAARIHAVASSTVQFVDHCSATDRHGILIGIERVFCFSERPISCFNRRQVDSALIGHPREEGSAAIVVGRVEPLYISVFIGSANGHRQWLRT